MGVIWSYLHTLIRILAAPFWILELLKALARDPDEKFIAIVEPGGDKGVDKLFSILQGQSGVEARPVYRGERKR